jgi:hypothetical protein
MTTQTRATAGRRRLKVLGSTSFDADKRTFTTSATSETPCPAIRTRKGKDGHDEMFEVMEVLLTSGCVNLAEVAGLPFVDSHDYSSIDKRLGVITAARIDGGNVVVDVELSDRASVREHDSDFKDGKLPFVSAGYQPLSEREPKPNPNGGPPIVEVTEWRLLEVSSVLVPADPTVGIRSKKTMTERATTESEDKVSIGSLRFLSELFTGKRAKRDDDMGDDETRRRGKRDDDEGEDTESRKRGKRDDDDSETDDERKARMAARKAKRDAEDNKDSDEPKTDDERKKRAADLVALRTVANNNGRAADFDALVTVGARFTELRSAVAGFCATSTPSVRTVAASQPGALAQAATDDKGLVDFSETAFGQRALKRSASR